jgi:hypothetical protein
MYLDVNAGPLPVGGEFTAHPVQAIGPIRPAPAFDGRRIDAQIA